MAITRKRKAQSPESSKQTISTASQKAISHYGRVTKSQKADPSSKKRKTVVEEAVKALSQQPSAKSDVQQDTKPPQSQRPTHAPSTVPAQANTKAMRKRMHEEPLETPRHKRFKNDMPPTPQETPSKAALHLFDRLSIETGPSSAHAPEQESYDTPPLTPKSFADLSGSQSIPQLPAQLQDIIRLFSAFMTSTSLFYAHHGSGTPLQMAFILQNATKAWKTRAATESDIRRLLAILGDSKFEIVDNGDGMVCLEQVGNMAPGHFNQPMQRARFEDQLRKLWSEWASRSAARKHDVTAFIEQLPLAEIYQGDYATANGANVKGQQRLNDIKQAATEARADEAASQRPVVSVNAKTSGGVASRGSSLLDRILAKEQLNSTRGSGPTQQELDRRAALNRIEDIIPVLDLLAGSRPRVSFSAQTMVSNLQNSLRNPISKEEVERCLQLMASEVAPAFLSMIRAGQVKGIVITRGGRPSNAELRQRLEGAGTSGDCVSRS